jgi:hypothetical protein
MLRSFTFFLLLLKSASLYSQILNVEKGRQEADSTNQFVGDLALDFSINNRSATADDENRLIGFNLNSDLGFIAKQNTYLLFSNLNFIYATDDPVIRTGYSHFRSTFLYKKPFSYELFGQIQFDLGRGLQFRQLAGGGLRFNILDSDDLDLHVGIGGMWERETWKFPDSDLETSLALLKSSNYFTIRNSFSDNASFGATFYYQTGFDNGIDAFRHRISIDTSLEFSLSDFLAFAVSFSGAFENEPVVPIFKYMYFLQNGIKFSF